MLSTPSKLTHLVGPIRGAVEHGLQELEAQKLDESQPDRYRHELLVTAANTAALERAIGPNAISYMNPALEDFWYIGAGAMHFAEQRTPDRPTARDIVRNSIPALLFPAHMPDTDGEWNLLKSDWSGQRETIGLVVPESKFQSINREGGWEITYSSGALIDMDSYVTPRSGCPARGPVLHKIFDKYITAIFV